MPILVKPTLNCNLNCKYCYQHGLEAPATSINKIISTMKILHEKTKNPMTLHGGEPLTIGHANVEKLLKVMFKLTKGTSIQTNATLIDKKYIQIFKKYKTHVGISIDGFEDGNILRCDAKTTNQILKTIDDLLEAGIHVNIITTVHSENAGTDTKLNRLFKFIEYMELRGITGRLNPNKSEYSLSETRCAEVYLKLAEFMTTRGLSNKWAPFSDVLNSLQRNSNYVCTFRDCDIYHTDAAEVVLGDGSITNCLRTEILLRHPQAFTTRNELLSKLEQSDGGCKDCKYFDNCRGGCPSNAPDWRMRDTFCHTYYELFKYYEQLLQSLGFNFQKENCTQPDKPQPSSNEHTDGIEHIDGSIRHLDSDIVGGNTNV